MSDDAEKAEIRCVCGALTAIVNTRGRNARNAIYRQRRCTRCGLLVSTYETTTDPEKAERAMTAARERLLEAVDVARKILAEVAP